MALTRRSWYRVGGAVVTLGFVACGAALLWSQQPRPWALPDKDLPRVAKPTQAPNASATPASAAAEPSMPQKPLGTWERKVGPLAVTLRFDNDQMHGTVHIKVKDGDFKDCTVTFRADYSVTKDSILYGVVSMADIKFAGKKMEGDDLGKLLEGVNGLQEQPFSMRYRVDGDEMVLHNLKFHFQRKGGEAQDGSQLNIGLGRFTRKAEATTAVSAKMK